MYSQHYGEKALFPLATSLLKWETFSPSFIADRSDVRISASFVFLLISINFLVWQWSGRTINPQAIAEMRPKAVSTLSSHLVGLFYRVQTLILTFVGLFPQASLESQLSDGREWLFDTEQPSLADISIYLIYAWARTLPTEVPLNPEVHSCTVKVRASCHSGNFTVERSHFVHTH
jgi:hypothetical protein